MKQQDHWHSNHFNKPLVQPLLPNLFFHLLTSHNFLSSSFTIELSSKRQSATLFFVALSFLPSQERRRMSSSVLQGRFRNSLQHWLPCSFSWFSASALSIINNKWITQTHGSIGMPYMGWLPSPLSKYNLAAIHRKRGYNRILGQRIWPLFACFWQSKYRYLSASTLPNSR